MTLKPFLFRLASAPARVFLIVLAAMLMVGCQPSEPTTSAVHNGVDSREVTDITGYTLAIPAAAQRIVTLSEVDLDAVLALGLKPVGSTAGRGQPGVPGYLQERGDGIDIVGALNRPNLDRLIALAPDLILAGGITDTLLLEQLRKIAPTVVTYALGDPWKSAFNNIAAMLGREAEAAEFIARYQQRITEIQQRLGAEQDAEVSVVRWIPQGPGYMLNQSFASLVLADLGLQRPMAQHQDGIAHSHSLSLEALHQIDADWMFVGTLNPAGDAAEAFATARETPVFGALSVVENDRMVAVDGSLWTSLGGPAAAMAILDDIERAMVTQAVAKDDTHPATDS